MQESSRVWISLWKKVLLWILSVGIVSGVTFWAGTVITSYTQNVSEWDIIWAAYYNSLNTLLWGTKSEGKICKYLGWKMVCVDDMPSWGWVWTEVDPVWAAEKDFKANIDSPNFTWVPTAPTPANGDVSNKLATTAFVESRIATAATGSGWTVTSVRFPPVCEAVQTCEDFKKLFPISVFDDNLFGSLTITKINSNDTPWQFNDIKIATANDFNIALNSANWVVPWASPSIVSVWTSDATWLKDSGTLLINCSFQNKLILTFCK